MPNPQPTLASALVLASAFALAASAAEPDAPVIAQLFGAQVVASDLDPAGGGAATLDAEALRRARGERLRAIVWSAVLEAYARTRDLEPTAAEVVSQIENGRRLAALLAAENERRRAAIAVELATSELDAARRSALELELDVLDQLLAHDAARRAELADPERQAARERAELRVAREWARKWKLDQALFRDFGGRIAFQQAGWEPNDAYRALLESYEAKGAFLFVDPAWRTAVYAYFDLDFVYLDETHARFYFEKPWWERTPEEMHAAGF